MLIQEGHMIICLGFFLSSYPGPTGLATKLLNRCARNSSVPRTTCRCEPSRGSQATSWAWHWITPRAKCNFHTRAPGIQKRLGHTGTASANKVSRHISCSIAAAAPEYDSEFNPQFWMRIAVCGTLTIASSAALWTKGR